MSILTSIGQDFSTGKITITPFRNSEFKGCTQHVFPNVVNFGNKIPVWEDQSKVPEDIKGKTLSEIQDSYGYNVYWSITVEYSGSKTSDCGSKTAFQIGIYRQGIDDPNTITLKSLTATSDKTKTGTLSGSEWTSNTLGQTPIDSVVFESTNDGKCFGINTICHTDNIAFITLTMTIGLTRFCTVDKIGTEQCKNYCYPNDIPNPTCYPNVRDFCMQDGNYVTNDWCLSYLQSIQDPQRIAFSNYLDDWCQQRYNIQDGTIDDVLNLPDDPSAEGLLDNRICACHLEQKFYDNFYDTIRQLTDIPTTFGQNKRCLYPQCAQSDFQRVSSTSGECSGPACMQIIDFDNNGQIDADNITFDQNINGCVNILDEDSSPVPLVPDEDSPLTPLVPGEEITPEETSSSKNLIIGLSIGGGIIAILLLIIATIILL